MKKLILAFAVCVTLSACASAPEPVPSTKQLDYSSLGHIEMATQDVRIVNRAYKVPQGAPYVGHLFKPTLTDAINRWAGDRLQAVGTTGRTTVIIKDASVTRTKIDNPDTGIESWFTRNQGSKYIGRVEVEVQALTPDGTMAVASANASHTVTLPEDPTSVEKYDAYVKLLDALMSDLNSGLEKAMHEHMDSFIVASEPPANFQPIAAEPVAQPAVTAEPMSMQMPVPQQQVAPQSAVAPAQDAGTMPEVPMEAVPMTVSPPPSRDNGPLSIRPMSQGQ